MINITKKFLSVLSILIMICGYGGIQPSFASMEIKQNQPHHLRIVSTSPSITESLFAIGLGKSVVGVTDYCNYPHEALKIAKIGGFINPNPEAIMRLRPDIIFVLNDRREQFRRLTQMGLKVVVVKQSSIGDIMNAMLLMGKSCNASSKAESVVKRMKLKIERIRHKTAGRVKPRILVCLGMGGSTLDRVYVAGRKCFFNDLINIAGGVNACTDNIVEMPPMTAEGLIELNPQAVIDLIPNSAMFRTSVKDERNQWAKLHQMSAVKNNKVYIFTKEYVVIPGPRFINTLEDIARAIHPEINWEKP